MSVDAILFPTLSLTVKSSLILLVALFFTRWLGRSRPALRHAVWGASLLTVLVLPLVSLVPLDVTVPTGLPAPPAEVMSRFGLRAPEAAVPSLLDRASTHRVSGRAPAFPLSQVLIAIYLIGLTATLLRLVAGTALAHGLCRSAAPITGHPGWRRALAASPSADARARVGVSKSVRTPFTFGMVRPTVLLPQDVADWSDEQKRSALAHELAHVHRRDPSMHLLAHLTVAVYWFHPLVRYAARRLRLEAERACDEVVVRAGVDPGLYAQQLVDLTRKQCCSRDLAAVTPMARRSDLRHRIESILASGRRPMRHDRFIATLAFVLAVSGLLTAPLEPGFARPIGVFDGSGPGGPLPPLMEAARRGDAEEVRKLIDRGAAVNERRSRRGTPLIHAADAGRLGVVKLLIEAGADVNLTETAGRRGDLLRSPLASAARGGYARIVTLLLEHGARVDIAPHGDATPIMEAARHGHGDVVTLLLEHGAEVNRSIRGDGNPLIAAARGGDLAVVRQLVEAGARVNDGVVGDGNALIAAVLNGDRSMVAYLLAQGADPNAYVPGDETALVRAAERKDSAMMRLLLDASESH